MFFLVAVSLVLAINLSWFAVSDNWLRKDLAEFPRAQKLTRWALLIWMAVVIIPIIGRIIPGVGNPLEYGPWLWLSVFYLWMGGIFFWMLGMGALKIPLWGYKRLKSRNEGDQAESDAEEGKLSRRQLIRMGLVAAPPLFVSGTAVTTWWGKKNLHVYTRDLPVANLPPDLEGFTITQLSDVHVGMLTGRERVDNIVAAANQLQSDMTVVTGDILDQDFKYMPDLLATVGALTAPLGVYLCIGNHDKIYNADKWVEEVRKAKLNLLLDESTVVDTGGTPIKLLGVDYARDESLYGMHIERAEKYVTAPENSLKILLVHHPHAFDAAAKAGISVTLAGHTHGGQIVFRAGEELELFNPGNLLFRYVDGIYRAEAGETLFVHKGSGDWFPLRMGAPSEVVQLRLVRG